MNNNPHGLLCFSKQLINIKLLNKRKVKFMDYLLSSYECILFFITVNIKTLLPLSLLIAVIAGIIIFFKREIGNPMLVDENYNEIRKDKKND